MKSSLSVLLLIPVLTLAGCFVRVGTPPSPRPYPPPPEYSDQPDSDLKARLGAARSISSFSKKDNALSVIAIDAAQLCDIYYTVKAISLMSSFTRRDSTAEKCADLFLEQHMIEEAKAVAGQVSSFSTKDRILSKIAQTPAVRPSEEAL
jgi:hypothetical protein